VVGLVAFVVVVLLSLLVTRVAAIILRRTGLSKEAAQFQARSAFSGVGYTTSEAESIVNHPVRRRVAMALMLLGSAGIVTALASLFLSLRGGGEGALPRLGILVVVLAAAVVVSRTPLFDRAIAPIADWAMRRWDMLHSTDYAAVLEVRRGYGVAEVSVAEGGWLAGATIGRLALRDEGVAVLGIHRAGGGYVAVPGASTVLEDGDVLTAYARLDMLGALAERPVGAEGDAAHADASERHRLESELERREDERPARGTRRRRARRGEAGAEGYPSA